MPRGCSVAPPPDILTVESLGEGRRVLAHHRAGSQHTALCPEEGSIGLLAGSQQRQSMGWVYDFQLFQKVLSKSEYYHIYPWKVFEIILFCLPIFCRWKKKSVHRGSFKPTLSIPLVLPTGQMPGRKYVLLILLLLHVSIDCACQAILRNGEGQEILSMLKTFLRHILYYQHPTTLHFNQELVAYVPVTQNTSPVCNFKTVPKHNSDEFILITF